MIILKLFSGAIWADLGTIKLILFKITEKCDMISKVITFHMVIMAMTVTGTIIQTIMDIGCIIGMAIITIIKQ